MMYVLELIKRSLVLLFLKVLPVKKDRYFFSSYGGLYTDSPKLISEEIHKLNENIEIIWLINKQCQSEIPNYVKKVYRKSIEALYYRGTANVLIDNAYADKYTQQTGISWKDTFLFKLETYLQDKKGQNVYSTWHGTPIKCMQRDQIGNCVVNVSCPNTSMFFENQYTLEIMKHLTFDKIRPLCLGVPRNDILCKLDSITKNKIKKKLDIPEEKNVILFAPTFRSDGKDGMSDRNIYRSGVHQLDEINFYELFQKLSEKFTGEWVFVCRFHHLVEEMVDWYVLKKQYPNQIINGNRYDDMSEYLACTDVLITDASSCMFDFSLTRKPCFLFFPDYEFYKEKERGFYIDIDKLPFPFAVSCGDLLKKIGSFDEETYKKNVEELHYKLGYIHENEATAKITKFILDENN